MPNEIPIPNVPQEMPESEEGLVSLAQFSISQCNWTVGMCAAQWTKKYAKGRTDGDFAALIGLSADQVYQRRRVSETFSDVREKYPSLKWSHFYTALNWDDAAECLQWAEENGETVAGMKTWRRLQHHGEEQPAETTPVDFTGDPFVMVISDEREVVRNPSEWEELDEPSKIVARDVDENADSAPSVAGVARDAEYSPFRSDAGSPPPSGSSEGATTATIAKPQLSAEQLVKKMTVSLERFNKALTPEIVAEFETLPAKLKTRFTNAVAELSSKAAGLL
ncbi:MAG: hypothetical protein Tsb009_35490 [Planctomycetaceae bacterium]